MNQSIGEPWPYNNPNWQNWNTVSYPLIQPTMYGWQCPICGKVYAPFVQKCETKHRKPKAAKE